MGEFDVEIRRAKPQEMAIAWGLSRVPGEAMTVVWTKDKLWEEVYTCLEETVETEVVDRVFEEMNHSIEYQPEVGLIIGGTSLLLYVDGACRGNGTSYAKASIGIYAGPGHPYTQGHLIVPTPQIHR